ncbi:restriction endonuclease [Helicobacter japonicus]|uniref:restriction endonuclease n=1 Tax=Helicobacter japonicus TaxID=425400 RepID=UPI00261E6C4E|nr:DEAD/DEAH box helicase family protein [Helicobacter japonicus]
MKFNAIIEQLIQETQTNTEQGKKFEILIKKILQVDCFLQKEFDIKEVYLWNEFSDKFHINRHDFGIDIILITMQDEIIAVQCKAFKPMHTLVIGDLKGFLGINTIIDNAGKEYAKISQSLLFHTCKKISTEVEMALEQNANEGKLKAIAFGYNELKNLEIDYQSLDLNAIATTTKSKDKKSLRPHQNEAFKAIKKHFVEQNNERGKVIMACGTGKSLLAIRTIDSMVENGEIAVFLTPSLALTNQMIKEFFAQSVSKDYKVFAVCSDSKVGSSIAPKDKNKDDVSDITSNELCIPATTSPIILAKSINALLHTPLDSAFKAMGGGGA